MTKIVQRPFNAIMASNLEKAGINTVLARVLSARGISERSQFEGTLSDLLPPNSLTNNTQMANLLADAIALNKKILIIGDYDADGATATAVAIKGLSMFGASVDFLVPNRFEYGYGLTPEIVELATKQKPDIIVTVDNGIASIDGVLRANELGIEVFITDHHLPADTSPKAACIINPNQHDCHFKSKNLAGVGVMFYCLLALRAELRLRGAFKDNLEPNLSSLLDLVALGTVADLVKLDNNNRILVEHGLERIRAGKCSAGITALLNIAGREPKNMTAQDLGFYVGPRLNAAGRLDDMRLGIQCLLAETDSTANEFAQTLHNLNAERRNIESNMQEGAMLELDDLNVDNQYSIAIFQPDWHQGIIGILASRIKERFHRPVIAFAKTNDGLLKGSGRSIPNFHLRDALDLITKRYPTLIHKFGGHAMAAGLTITQKDFTQFQVAFELVACELLSAADLTVVIETDGMLSTEEISLKTAKILEQQVWGQGFPQPLFCDKFKVISQRVLADKHLKLILEKDAVRFDAMYFGHSQLLPAQIQAVYQLQTNEFRSLKTLQLLIKMVSSNDI